MAYTGSVEFSLIDGISQGYNTKVKNVAEADEATASFEDTLANVNDNSDDVAVTDAATEKKDGNSELKAAELANSGNNRKEALNAVSKKEFDNSDMEQMSDEMAGLVQELINSIMQMLEQKLGMTTEELQSALEECGMTEFDLLSAGNLTQFVVDVKADGNLSELLVDEDLHAAVTELTDALEAAADDIAEELGEDFEQIKTEFAEYTETAAAVAPEVKSVEADSNPKSDTHSETGNNQASDSMVYNNTGMLNEVVNNIAQNVSEISDTQVAADIVHQVIEQIKVRVTEDVTSMELQLTPESLGKINLQVSSKNGVVTAQITTETLIAKEAIESQVALLKENLNEQGVKVEAVEVTVSPHQFETRDEEQRERSNDEQQTSRRRFIDVEGNEEEQFDEAAAIAREIMMSGGNRMDIRA